MYASSSTVEENVGVLHIFAAPAADPRGFALSGKLHLNCFSCLKFKRSVDMTPLGRIRPLSQNKIYVSGDTKWYNSNTAANYWLDNLEQLNYGTNKDDGSQVHRRYVLHLHLLFLHPPTVTLIFIKFHFVVRKKSSRLYDAEFAVGQKNSCQENSVSGEKNSQLNLNRRYIHSDLTYYPTIRHKKNSRSPQANLKSRGVVDSDLERLPYAKSGGIRPPQRC